jgi:hypothetical protein
LHYAENDRKSATFFAPQSFPKAPQSIDKQRKTSNHNGLLVFSVLVEMGGVEPPSESALTGTSPGAAGFCGTLCVPVPFRTGKPASLSVR